MTAPVHAIWFAAPERERPMFTTMGRMHPNACPLQAGDAPESWVDAYGAETDPLAALTLAAEDADDLRNHLQECGEASQEDARADFAPVLVPVRIHDDGAVEFSETDLVAALGTLRGQSGDEVLRAAEAGEITAEDLERCLADANFPGGVDFTAGPAQIYASHGATPPALTQAGPSTTPWLNCGDINPENGTLLLKLPEARLDDRDLTVPAVRVIPESDVGGSDHVFLLQKGIIFLARRNFASALYTIGFRLDGERLVSQQRDAAGRPETVYNLASPDGLRTLAEAANAYGGIDDVDISVVVSVGLPQTIDQDRQFDGETVYYPEKTSLWAIMREALEEPEIRGPKEVRATGILARAEPFPEDLLEGMPPNLATRADLAGMAAFAGLEVDSAGNPCVWRNHYRDDSVEDGYAWSSDWSSQRDEDGQEPWRTEWIGPESEVLRTLWEELPEREGPVVRDEPDEDGLSM